METTKKIEVLIDGKVYVLAGTQSEQYMQQVASYVNKKILEIKAFPSYKKLNKEYKDILLALNISDDLFETKRKLEVLHEKCSKQEKERYDLKEELSERKIEKQAADKMIAKYQQEIEKLQKRIMELETEAL